MDGYLSNSQCILDYLALFQALSSGEAGAEQSREMWDGIRRRELASGGVPLAPPRLRQRFGLEERDFLLMMAALALEMDGELRNAFHRKYQLPLPTVEYGLHLIAPICPVLCETFAKLAGRNTLCGLLLTTAEWTAYPLERPLVLCREVLAYLTGLSEAEIPGCAAFLNSEEPWMPLYEEEARLVRAWRTQGAKNTLYLCAPSGSGRRTLLRRACGNVVYVELGAFDGAPLTRDRALREAAVRAILLDAAVCAMPGREQEALEALERLCGQYALPLAVLVEEEGALGRTKEVVRLTGQLSPVQRQEAWRRFLPRSSPDAVPRGAMTIGAVKETALLAFRFAVSEGRRDVSADDTRRAMLQRGGALEFGVRYQSGVRLEDMVLSGGVREQLELICREAVSGGKLAAWSALQQGEGITAVFHGPSGTGKTMAAQAIAARLGMPLLRADLSRIMDKYVGETEKHLRRLFRSARENHCVLLFDEADALFGKRAAVSTGQDKYANLSTSYLLQEIEQYDGVAILSTNLLSSFDEAFLRRLRYIVRIGLPDAGLRESLWRRALPEEQCEGLPYALLAQVELSPARILSAARGAVTAALDAGVERPTPFLVVKALRLELEKNGKPLPWLFAEWM